MKIKLLDILLCPDCQNRLELDIFSKNNEEIEEGLLTCIGCQSKYPIINSIPRMLPKGFKGSLLTYHKDFFQRHSLSLEDYSTSVDKVDLEDEIKKDLLRSYSFQWNVFDDMYEFWKENFLDYIHPLDEKFFNGKFGLDAGCGFGRHLYYAALFGAEIVGMDLSEAVEASYRNTKGLPNVHIVQGDIYNPPFRKDIFDFVYSIGVLHYLPNPKDAFKSLVQLVKPNGTISAWVYGPRFGISERITVILRKFTPKMNYKLLYGLCFMIALYLRLFSHYPYKVLRNIPLIRRIGEKLPLKEHAIFPFRIVLADTFNRLMISKVYYYTGEQFREWFEEAGLRDIQITRRFKNNESFRGIGVKRKG